MHKIFLSLLALFAVATGFNRVQKTPSKSSLVEPVTQITYSDGNFSGTNNFTITKSGAGFVANSTYPQAFNISDKASYLEIKPNSSTAISSDNGFSIALNLSSKDGEDTDSYEQLLTVEGDGGLSAHINVATLYYLASSSASTTYAVPNGGNKLTLDSSKKYQIFVVDYEAESIFVYVNGTLTNKFTPDNNKADVIADVIEAFKLLKTNGTSLFLRKPCAKKTARNTSSIIAANISLYNSVISAEQAAKMFEDGSTEERNDLPISVDSCDDYRISSVGYGIEDYDSEHPNSFRIADIGSYIKIKSADDKKLTQDGKGFSMSFFHQSTTDTFYSGNTKLRPNVTDDFEQLLTVEGDNSKTAHICTGGIYYSEDGVEYTYKFSDPSGSSHSLLTTAWKYVTINVNSETNYIQVFVDGVEAMYFDKNSATTKSVVALFADKVSALGGEIFIRKPFALKSNRNSATNVLDDILLSEWKTESQIKALHDQKLGNIRISFVPNIDVQFNEVVGKNSVTIPPYEGQVEGYIFSGFYFDEEHTQLIPDNYVFTESATVYPYFAPVSYTITYHLDGGVNGNNPTQYTRLDEITFEPASKDGYLFIGWYRTANFENKVTMLVEGSLGDIDLYAKFAREIYHIEYVLNGGLLSEEATETYTVDDGVINLPNAWKPNCTFDGWYLEEEFVNKIETLDSLRASDLTIYAKFTENKEDEGDKDDDKGDDKQDDKDEGKDDQQPGKNSNTGLIIGLSIGGAVLLGAAFALILKFVIRRKV